MSLVPLLLLAFQASSDAPAQRPLSVREVIENAEALDGREILVSGWVEYCYPLACVLHASRRESRRGWPSYYLGIGRSAWFDAFVRRNGPSRITLRARFDARCVTDPASGIIAACADRVSSLRPIAVIATSGCRHFYQAGFDRAIRRRVQCAR